MIPSLLGALLAGTVEPAPAASPGAKTTSSTAAAAAATPGASDSRADTTAGARRPPELFLAWRAPFGTPGALRDVALRGGEAARPETLYLSFDPGRDSETFYGLDATLLFRVPIGDTLGSLWRFGGGSMNRRNVQIEFPTAESAWGCERPFASPGFGAPSYRYGPESGDLQLIFAVPTEQAAPIRTGRRYCFGRVIFPAGSTMDDRDGQAVCIEWVKADFSFALEGDGTSVLGRPVERFVAVNSPGAKVCASFRGAPDTWAPAGTKPR
jgi:hypothetical protein